MLKLITLHKSYKRMFRFRYRGIPPSTTDSPCSGYTTPTMSVCSGSSQSSLCSRYNLFIVLYPLGVVGELLTIYAALPIVRRTAMYSLRLPNKYNVSFDYYYFLIIAMLSYIPRKTRSPARHRSNEGAIGVDVFMTLLSKATYSEFSCM